MGEWSKDTYTAVTIATSVSQYPSKDIIYINRWTDRWSVERTGKRHHELSSEHYVWFQASATKWRRSMVFWDITTTTIHCVISENTEHMNITLTQLHDRIISSRYTQWYTITCKSKMMKANWINFKKQFCIDHNYHGLTSVLSRKAYHICISHTHNNLRAVLILQRATVAENQNCLTNSYWTLKASIQRFGWWYVTNRQTDMTTK